MGKNTKECLKKLYSNIPEEGRYEVKFSLYDSEETLVNRANDYKSAITCVMEIYSIVKNAECSNFTIIDTETGVNTIFESTERGLSILANIKREKPPEKKDKKEMLLCLK